MKQPFASHVRQFRQIFKVRLRFLFHEIDEETMNEQIKPVIHHIEPDLAAAWYLYNLGVQLPAEGKIDEAMSIFERAIAQYPSLAEAHCALGFLKFTARDPNSAAERFQTALKHNPSLHQAQLGLGIIPARTGEDQKAEQILRGTQIHRRARPIRTGAHLCGSWRIRTGHQVFSGCTGSYLSWARICRNRLGISAWMNASAGMSSCQARDAQTHPIVETF
jgi:Tfp pilus assembly protein PilF